MFESLLFVAIGNHAITALLCVAVWYMGTDLYDKTDEYKDMSQHINATLYIMTLCIIISSISSLNLPMYFIGYLYEVTELVALFLTDCNDRDDEHNFVYSNQAKLLINNLVSLHPFHKTLFPLVFARYGWVTDFWIFPSLFLFFAAYDKTSGGGGGVTPNIKHQSFKLFCRFTLKFPEGSENRIDPRFKKKKFPTVVRKKSKAKAFSIF